MNEWVWGIRGQVSLLLDHGHPEAWSYPVGLVMQESELVVDRLNAAAGTNALLLQMAVSTVPNMSVKPEGTKSMLKQFGATIKTLLKGD